MNDEEYIIKDDESGEFNQSFDLARLELPQMSLFSVRKSAVEYDESEGVSEKSIASGSCKSPSLIHADSPITNNCYLDTANPVLPVDLATRLSTLETEKAALRKRCNELERAGSHFECERIGEELVQMTQDRNRLKLLLKTNKANAVLLKETQSQNEALREALKQRNPNTAFAILSPQINECVVDERISQLEETLARVDEQWIRRMNSLKEQHEQIKKQYETAKDEDIIALENRIGTMKDYYARKREIKRPLVVCSSPVVCIGTLPKTECVLQKCVLNRAHITKSLTASDVNGSISRASFIRCLTDLDFSTIEKLVDTYAFGEKQLINYKWFLSDLASRSGVYTIDLETENKTLRTHINALMTELNDKMKSIESGELVKTLKSANEQLLRKEQELEQFKRKPSKTPLVKTNRNKQ